MGAQMATPGPQAGQTGAASKPKFPPKPPWPIPLAPIPETNSRKANESAFAPRTPGPPKNDVPKLRRPPSKFGIRDTPDPMPEPEKPERPKEEFPKSEEPKP